MSRKIAACAVTAAADPSFGTAEEAAAKVAVREYDEEKDMAGVEEMERMCDEMGQCGKTTIVSDLMGDPLCRVRHFPSHIMLVAEHGEERKIVGVVRGCVKSVTRGNSIHVKLAYILGLRVSPIHRNLGIGTKLVQALEEWFKQQGAEYAYMATDCTNAPSINLFTKKCSYLKFRTLTMLVQPVHAHTKPIGSNIAILRLNPRTAELVYRRIFANSEFFPKDIDSILSSNHSLGTYMAVPKKYLTKLLCGSVDELPSSFAILSVWSTKEVFKLQVKGASRLTYTYCAGTRLLDSWMPWLRLPSFPDVFKKFWVYFLYGLHMEGKNGPRLMKALCSFVHNMGTYDEGCGAVVAEVSTQDPVAAAVPHWRRLSWAEDLWCLKKLSKEGEKENETEQCSPSDWTRSRPYSPVVFVDPRDI